MKFTDFVPGATAWATAQGKMGNTTLRTTNLIPFHIVSVDPDKQTVMASKYNDQPRSFSQYSYSKWRKDKPLLVKSRGGYRLANREEIAAEKQRKAQVVAIPSL